MSQPKKKPKTLQTVVAKGRKKPPKGSITALEERLAKLHAELADGPKSGAEARLLVDIRTIEARLKIERFHRVSKLSSVNPREILCGSPGLGKNKS